MSDTCWRSSLRFSNTGVTINWVTIKIARKTAAPATAIFSRLFMFNFNDEIFFILPSVAHVNLTFYNNI